MRRLTLSIVLGLVVLAATTGAAYSRAANLCVGNRPTCFGTIQAAVDAAHDGDTITIAQGTYAGGVRVDVSVNLIGSGANTTIIKGGGPVLTIGVGQQFPANEPTVAIRGVTITGGVTTSSYLGDWIGYGGGVEIPPSCTTGPQCASFEYGPGATVTIADSVIAENTVVPQTTASFCSTPCAFADGGGIDNTGALTVTNTRISDNTAGRVGSVTSGADAGGINNFGPGSLTLRHSAVIGNRVVVGAPNGQFAGAGGVSGGGTATIEDTVVSNNVVEVAGVSGEADAFAGGIDADGSLNLNRSTIDHNEVHATLSSSSPGFVIADAGGIEIDGTATINNTSVVFNTVSAAAPGGTVVATGGGLLSDSVDGVAIRDSLIGHNTIVSSTPSGAVFVQGGGVTNFGLMTLAKTVVIDNLATADATAGVVQGGGIWNSNFDGGPPTVPKLSVRDSVIAANKLSARAGVTVQGGGLYTTFPVTSTRVVIAGNRPDQCFGC